MRRLPALLALLAVGLLANGCGNARAPAPDADTPGSPLSFSKREVDDAGLALKVPNGWRVAEGAPPQVIASATGTAVLTVWRYPRIEPLPGSDDELRAALDNLTDAARARDPDLRVRDAEVTRIDDRPAVEIVAEGTIAGRRRVLHSVHVYAFASEYVIDAYARPRDFQRVDEDVFEEVLDSIRLSEPMA